MAYGDSQDHEEVHDVEEARDSLEPSTSTGSASNLELVELDRPGSPDCMFLGRTMEV
jgi:hypothetical protein